MAGKKKHCLVGIHSRRPKTTVAEKVRKARVRTRKHAFLLAQSERMAAARAAL
ncbi:MAG: hypothetical protein U9Q15_01430 [Patescibacteria group bacterium]|nr:hypothetical protein [Patescibacteria group bacterium]